MTSCRRKFLFCDSIITQDDQRRISTRPPSRADRNLASAAGTVSHSSLDSRVNPTKILYNFNLHKSDAGFKSGCKGGLMFATAGVPMPATFL